MELLIILQTNSIGRVTEGLLTQVAEKVDIIEPITKFTDVLEGKPGVGNIFNVGLEGIIGVKVWRGRRRFKGITLRNGIRVVDTIQGFTFSNGIRVVVTIAHRLTEGHGDTCIPGLRR